MMHFRRHLSQMGAASSVCFALVAVLASGPVLGGAQELTVSGAWMRFIMPSVPAAGYFRLSYLLDTDVVSELRKVKAGKAHPNVAAWSATVAPTETLPRMN